MKWVQSVLRFKKKKKSVVGFFYFYVVHLGFKEHIDRRNCIVLSGKTQGL